MDYEALDSLQQTLLQIYERDDDLTFRRVKQRILCIRDKAVVLQFLKQYFPEKERIREVADTIEEIIQYLFSPQNLSDRGSVDPTVRLSDQLGELAEDLDSIVEDVVDYIRQQSDPPPALRSSSSSDPPVVAAELIVINSNGLRRLAEKLKSTDRELPDEDPSDSAPIFPLTSNDVVAGFDDDLSDSASITSSSRSAPTSKDLEVDSNEDLVVGFDENHLVGSNDDVVQIIERVTSRSSSLQILPIVAVGGIGESAFAKYIYDHPTIMGHFDMRAWITITQDYSTESILSKSLASVKGKDHLGRDFLTEFEVGAYDLDVTGTIFFWGRYLIVMDGMWSVEVWDKAQRLFVKHYDGSTIILVTRQMDVAAYFARRGGNLMMPFLDDGQSWLATNKDLVVGFHEDMQQLMDRLIRDSKLHIQTIPIVGMGGIAEGFLERHSESERVELVAEECLEDLIKQSLVLVTSRKIDGKIKSCRLHSMVRDFCVRKAGKEKFLLPVMDFFPNPILRRNDHSYWELGQVFELIYLTYLAFSIPDSIVPPAIAKLQNLQTLIIYRFDVHLPVEIWRLRQLRHLIAFSFHSLPIPKVASPLRNLQTLSIATNFVCGERIVKIIPSIRKLGICYSEEEFGADYHLDNLIHFLRLEKLKLKTHSSSAPHPYSLIFPLSLIKLELSGGWICWTDMAIVGSLPDLQVLKLKNYACHGEHWETVGGEFRKLMLLLIDESDLNHWKTRSSHFPRLKCLMLHRCPYLDEIPHDIGNITTLELIEIDDRNRSLSYSTNIIREMHRKVTGDDSLKVVKRS
ncbi:putative late blight resistance protein R1B-16 [Salvia divinorum]|uniref:Late blight resistance protein R1B-16 n=1 Tax=Salvia divinorum TaxID=28513 RepID=A0ABD1GVG6_SALDI